MPNYGIDPIFMKRIQNELSNRLMFRGTGKRAAEQQGLGAYTGGPTGGQFGTMSQTTPTAEDRNAFTAQNIARAQYGRYGKGGLERDKLANERRLREMIEAGETGRTKIKEQGATGRNIYSEQAATGRTKLAEDRQRQQDIMRYHPGDAFTPQGLESRHLDILRRGQEIAAQQAQQKANTPQLKIMEKPKMGGEGAYVYQPGDMQMRELPIVNQEAPILRDKKVAEQQPKGIDPAKWINSLPPEEQEYWRRQWQQRNGG